MNTAFVIKEAILSEKAYVQMAKGIYAFKVDKRATKKEIGNAVSKQFSVSVTRVNVINQSSKKRRISGTRKEAEIIGVKKAIVCLKPGQTIAMLSPKTEAKKEKSPKTKVTKSKESKKEEKKSLLSRIKKSNAPEKENK